MKKEVVIKTNHFNYGSERFFRKCGAQLGGYGRKTQSALNTNGIGLLYGSIDNYQKAGISVSPKISFDFSKVTNTDFDAKLNLEFATFNGDAKGGVKKSRKTGTEAVLVQMDIEDMNMLKKLIKRDEECWEFMKDIKKSRIVTTVFVVVHHSHYDNRWTNANWKITGSGNKNNLKIEGEVSGASSSESKLTLEIGVGSIFAYGLSKLTWDKKKREKATKIKEIRADEWSFQ